MFHYCHDLNYSCHERVNIPVMTSTIPVMTSTIPLSQDRQHLPGRAPPGQGGHRRGGDWRGAGRGHSPLLCVRDHGNDDDDDDDDDDNEYDTNMIMIQSNYPKSFLSASSPDLPQVTQIIQNSIYICQKS